MRKDRLIVGEKWSHNAVGVNRLTAKRCRRMQNPFSKVFRFYRDGFAGMQLGRTLWLIILFKLFILFLIIKPFFFPDILQTRFQSDDQRAALLGSFKTTAAELYIFEEDNQEAITQYLSNNPDTQQTINSLSAQITALTNKIKVPYYCMTVVANTRLEIKNATELVALAQRLSNDKDLFLEQEQATRKKHNTAKDALFKSFDRTTNEYLTFMSKNKEAVEQYLTNHPLIKNTIDGLSKQVGPLVEEFESLREEIVKEPDLPPIPE